MSAPEEQEVTEIVVRLAHELDPQVEVKMDFREWTLRDTAHASLSKEGVSQTIPVTIEKAMGARSGDTTLRRMLQAAIEQLQSPTNR